VPVAEISKATGLYNLTRQLGGSIGIAVLTTLLASRQAFHRNVLVESVGASDPGVLARLDGMAASFVANGFDPIEARHKALALLDATVSVQASVLSFADMFWIAAMLFAATLPLVLLLGKGQRKLAGVGAH